MALPRPLLIVLVSGVLGCAGAQTPYPVKGVIRYEDEQPATDLAGGLVTFDSEALHVSAMGPVHDDGSYELTTFQERDGAPAGPYRVAVVPPEPKKSEHAPTPRRSAIDPRFRTTETSGLEVTVEKKSNDIPLKVERAKARP